MMKKIVSVAVLLVMVFSVMFGMSSCVEIEGDGQKMETDFFVYSFKYSAYESTFRFGTQGDYGVILHLTELGKEQERIIIPDYLDGKPVVQTGLMSPVGIGHRVVGAYEKLYLPSGILNIVGDSTLTWVKNFLIDLSDLTFLKREGGGNAFYLSKRLFDEYMNTIEESERYENINVANVTYMCGDEVFFIDDYDEGELIDLLPPVPTREGFRFDGWFKDESCTVAWNFNSDTVVVNYDANNKLIYEETCLYAKWIED